MHGAEMLFQRPVQVCAGQEIAFGDVYLNSRGFGGGQGMVLGFEPRATYSSPELSAQPSWHYYATAHHELW